MTKPRTESAIKELIESWINELVESWINGNLDLTAARLTDAPVEDVIAFCAAMVRMGHGNELEKVQRLVTSLYRD